MPKTKTQATRTHHWGFLKALRKCLDNMTQAKLADRIGAAVDSGTDDRTIRRWEKGETGPHPSSIDRLAEALEIPKATLIAYASAYAKGKRFDCQAFRKRRRARRHIISGEDHAELEAIACDAAIAGGITAMGFFKAVLSPATPLATGPNPATNADAQATLAIVRHLIEPLDRFTNNRGLRFVVFGEELDENSAAARLIDPFFPRGGNTALARTVEDFQRKLDAGRLGVLIDALDGTSNFVAGLPLFCTAVAVFDGHVPRVGAIYNPVSHVLWYGSVATEGSPGRAFEWHIGATSRVPLSATSGSGVLRIATHLSRSDPRLRKRFLPRLDALAGARGCQGIYLLNSGQLAMALVAASGGGLSAFANVASSAWDVAAGEVLVRAVGGKVTDFEGRPIDYGAQKVQVLAARDASTHRRLRRILAGPRRRPAPSKTRPTSRGAHARPSFVAGRATSASALS